MCQAVRMWINQPSTLQPLHHLHGTNVLAIPEGMMVGRFVSIFCRVTPFPCKRHGYGFREAGNKL